MLSKQPFTLHLNHKSNLYTQKCTNTHTVFLIHWKTHTNSLLYLLPPSDIFLLLPNSLFHLTINNASSEFRAIPIYCLLLEKFFVQKRCWHGDLFLSLIWSVSTVLSLHITFILSTTMLYIFGLNKLIANPFFLKNPFKLHIYIGC